MGSRFSLCLGLNKKNMAQENKYDYQSYNQVLNHIKAIPHILLESENENPSQVGTIWNEV